MFFYSKHHEAHSPITSLPNLPIEIRDDILRLVEKVAPSIQTQLIIVDIPIAEKLES